MLGGMHRRLLRVNLSDGSSQVEVLDEAVLQKVIGGKGLGAYLLWQNAPARVDPLSPANPLIFAVGPATDTELMGVSRYSVFAKSPLTGFYGESYAGGKVAPVLKRTGFDAVLIEGRAEKPVYLEISPQGAKVHRAAHLWGMDTMQAEDALLREVGVKGAQAVVIGPAGEKLVRFALIENNYWRSAGRTGLGAVMGAKKLKGIVFWGDRSAPLADAALLAAYSKDLLERAKVDPGVNNYRTYGTPNLVAVTNKAGCFPSRYWAAGKTEGWEKISGQALLTTLEVRRRACPRCYLACGKLTTVREGSRQGLTVEGPEYETIYAFGGLCGVDNLPDILYLNDLCDRLGLDTISAGNVAGLAIEASRRGRIDYSIDYGQTERIAEFLRLVSQRQGIGDLFAEGTREAGRRLGLEDLAVHVKGLEPAGYDPRVLKGMALSYAVSARGACHLRTTFYKAELSGLMPPEIVEGKAAMLIDWENRLALFDCLILCRFLRDLIDWEGLRLILRATLGLEITVEELRHRAAGVVDLTRHYNLREGLRREDDLLPARLYREPLGPDSLTEEEFNYLLADYYRQRGWDEEGRPPLDGYWRELFA